ncbi:MAG: [protein-PII] uridylyltransferase [Bacteroidota bacterium]
MTIKELFKQEYDAIFRYHRAGGEGIAVAAELSELVDRTLTNLWFELPEESRASFAVVALGGYGRYEMAPCSDVDVMVLFADEETKKANSDAAQKFLHSMWNLGFDVGHSVRTIDDCLNLYQTDVDVWASVLESRYVCGSESVMEQYTQSMLSTIKKKQDLKFIASVVAGVDERHYKYDHSVKLLEPNLKNSAGGLRDLHSLVWIFRSTDPKYFTLHPYRSNESACVSLIEQFASDGIISSEERNELVSAFNFILRLRNEMQYAAEALQDTLEFAKQLEIARGIGFKGATPVESVERCMREYFLHARAIYRFNRRLVNQFRKSVTVKLWSKLREQVLDDYYVIRDGQLYLKNISREFSSPADVLHGFYWCGLHSIELSAGLLSTFESLSRDQKFFSSEMVNDSRVAAEFLNILRLQANVGQTLQMMNDCDILGKIIPEWGNLVAFFQHSMYHYYTTDAHTLIALEHAEDLRGSTSLLGDVFRSLRDKELLYLAILFHDIAKPSGIEEHEIRGVDMWRDIQQRWNIHDVGNSVSFLIRNHLIMEQIAFRRNTGDMKTIEEFARLFSRPDHLDLLFVLTYADLSAVNKNVWSSWKETLLQELYLKTRRILLKQEQTEEQTYPQNLREHIAAFKGTQYTTAFTADEIDDHVRCIKQLDSVETRFRNDLSHSIVTVVTRDAQSLLSNLCGVLSANDISIIDANIFTRNDGIVIDQFRVVDGATRSTLTAEQEKKLQNDFGEVLRNHETLNHLFERHHRRWKRRAKPLFHPSIRVDVVFYDTEKYTIMDVYGPDMTGFLYKITQAISKQGFKISFAKLATRGDGIVDTFYISEHSGKKISNRELTNLREKILHTISQLISVQMGE